MGVDGGHIGARIGKVVDPVGGKDEDVPWQNIDAPVVDFYIEVCPHGARQIFTVTRHMQAMISC